MTYFRKIHHTSFKCTSCQQVTTYRRGVYASGNWVKSRGVVVKCHGCGNVRGLEVIKGE